tara:strand:- start:1150 stop:2103 length:954 start_codon:yes stop_codon:yes gene_type:complete
MGSGNNDNMARTTRGRKNRARSNKSSENKKAKLGMAIQPTVAIAVVGLMIVSTITGGILWLMSNNDEPEDNPISNIYGVGVRALSNDHKTPAEEETDFVLLVTNTGDEDDTYTITEKNYGLGQITIEEGYEEITVKAGKHKPLLIHVRASGSSNIGDTPNGIITVESNNDSNTTAEIELRLEIIESYGDVVHVGDGADIWYIGIWVKSDDDPSLDGYLFDTNNQTIYESDYPRESSASKHYNPLSSSNIGCNGSGNPSEDCDGARGLIVGFDAKLVGMKAGQTLAVRIPSAEAYGDGDRIFEITIEHVDHAHHDDDH